MLTQIPKVAPPLPNDHSLSNFSETIQRCMETLFQAAHVHKRISTVPNSRTGEPGDIYLFDDGTNIYLYIKTSRGWAKSSAFTLI